MNLKLAIALGALLISGPANAALNGVEVNGSLQFNGIPVNYYDSSNGFVPAGYGNSGGQPVTIGAGIEFGFIDGANQDTADFTDTQLFISDALFGLGAAPWEMSFTSLTAGAFGGLSLVSDGFNPGLNYGLLGDTITINWAGTDSFDVVTYDAVFDITAASGVPEPATWAMMLLGFGAIGFAMRRRNRRELTFRRAA